MCKEMFYPADILLPKSGFEKWAVIACDQFTSQQEYWDEVEKTVGCAPSALRITLPEIFLEDNPDRRIEQINLKMQEYLDGQVFDEYKHSMIYVERKTGDQKVRRGIVGLIDLEDYEYTNGTKALIRATEQTVLERIPPRVKIRKDALVEMPHIMLLIDDPEFTVIEPLQDEKSGFEKVYDFELMLGGGQISGYILDDLVQKRIQSALSSLIEDKEDKFLFAVGDGNHSLATAKECYKLSGCELARYALVEIVNIHDASLEFEPIYRVLFGVNAEKVIDDICISLGGEYHGEDAQVFECVWEGKKREISLKPTAKLPVGTLQTFLDSYLKDKPEIKIDYIHGEQSVYDLCNAKNTLGFIFKGMTKSELFDAISSDGSLPRKTFSMGHAVDKRYYVESRKIK
ncbi:MAG: DUF1015 domain-containing protein [bacterium]|nr:DUF1015 domain-containing protein [bacterium]